MKNLQKCKLLFWSVIITGLSILLSACSEETIDTAEPNSNTNLYSETGEKLIARNQFAEILAKAMQEKEIREFIKNEALKEIDKDYDVIYHYVKDKKLTNGTTFCESLAKYCESQSYLDSITDSDYTLTILVPYLDDKFSANTWDTQTQIPKVVVRSSDKKEKLKTYGISDQFFVERFSKPEFPVLVVKENERLIDVRNFSQLRSLNTQPLSNNAGTFAFFIDNEFVNKEKISLRNTWYKRAYKECIEDNKILASTLSNRDCIRDYIYYNISPELNQQKGALDTDYREAIVSLQFNTPSGLSTVNDIHDPLGDWSNGNLDIVFDFIFVDRSGNPLTLQKKIDVPITKLFDKKDSPTKTLCYILPEPLIIFNWDLYNYGNIYKITISEFDHGNTIETTQSISSTFGGNFETSPSIDLGIVKIGNKYGSSFTETKQSSIKINMTNNSDPLGEVLVNFFDPIFTNENITLYFMGWTIQNFAIQETKTFKRGDIVEVEKWFQSLVRMPLKYYDFSDQTNYQKYKSNTGTVTVEIVPTKIFN
ncbi:MAG: hypothetical protein E6772_11515 [Dysgonomonas sp.]|nr:hypothetical protein [Dysgonomonas sp.]